jgi:hypothetical protein
MINSQLLQQFQFILVAITTRCIGRFETIRDRFILTIGTETKNKKKAQGNPGFSYVIDCSVTSVSFHVKKIAVT